MIKTYIKATTVPNKKTDLIDDYKTDNAHTWSSEKISKNYELNKEIDTGDIWIDGKKIYAKVVTFPFTSNQTISYNANLGEGISSQWIDFGHSYAYNSSYGFRTPWNISDIYVNNKTVYCTTSHPSGDMYITILYTK